MSVEDVYAPIPEEDTAVPRMGSRIPFRLPKLPRFRFALPAVNINLAWLKKFQFTYFQNLSRAGKFFFISFTVFLLLFLINLGIYAGKLQAKKNQSRAQALADLVQQDIDDTKSSLIYKTNDETLVMLQKTLDDLDELARLDQTKASEDKKEEFNAHFDKNFSQQKTNKPNQANPLQSIPADYHPE